MKKNYSSIDELKPFINIRSYSRDHSPEPPVSLVIIGRKKQIINNFKMHGWFLAKPITFVSAIHAALATLFNESYHEGPMYPSYVNGKRNSLGLERPTKTDSFRRRHHLRLWRTKFRFNRQPVWLGTISYDRSAGHKKGSLTPVHHINPTLRLEEDFLAETLEVAEPLYIRTGKKESGVMYGGESYTWDGKALVLDLTNEA